MLFLDSHDNWMIRRLRGVSDHCLERSVAFHTQNTRVYFIIEYIWLNLFGTSSLFLAALIEQCSERAPFDKSVCVRGASWPCFHLLSRTTGCHRWRHGSNQRGNARCREESRRSRKMLRSLCSSMEKVDCRFHSLSILCIRRLDRKMSRKVLPTVKHSKATKMAKSTLPDHDRSCHRMEWALVRATSKGETIDRSRHRRILYNASLQNHQRCTRRWNGRKSSTSEYHDWKSTKYGLWHG